MATIISFYPFEMFGLISCACRHRHRHLPHSLWPRLSVLLRDGFEIGEVQQWQTWMYRNGFSILYAYKFEREKWAAAHKSTCESKPTIYANQYNLRFEFTADADLFIKYVSAVCFLSRFTLAFCSSFFLLHRFAISPIPCRSHPIHSSTCEYYIPFH